MVHERAVTLNLKGAGKTEPRGQKRDNAAVGSEIRI